MHSTIWIKSLPLVLIGQLLTVPALAYPPNHLLLAQAAANYDSYMKQGYTATAHRNYKNALIYFRKAEQLRPSDRYATVAISNVSRYVRRGQEPNVREFIASGSGKPNNIISASSRSLSSCSSKEIVNCLVAILPESGQDSLSTVADYPVVFFYVPKTAAQMAEFILKDAANSTTYTVRTPPPKSSGIVSINLADLKDSAGNSLPPLKVGKTYIWQYSLVLDQTDHSNDFTVDSSVTRKALDPTLMQMLKEGKAAERLSLYGANDLWYDYFATLYQELEKYPNNKELQQAWTATIHSINPKFDLQEILKM